MQWAEEIKGYKYTYTYIYYLFIEEKREKKYKEIKCTGKEEDTRLTMNSQIQDGPKQSQTLEGIVPPYSRK